MCRHCAYPSEWRSVYCNAPGIVGGWLPLWAGSACGHRRFWGDSTEQRQGPVCPVYTHPPPFPRPPAQIPFPRFPLEHGVPAWERRRRAACCPAAPPGGPGRWRLCLPCRSHRQVHADREMAGHGAAPGAPRKPHRVAEQVGPVRERRAAHPAPHRAFTERAADFRQCGSHPWEDSVPTKLTTPGQAEAPQWQIHEEKGAEKEIPHLHRRGQRVNGHLWEKQRIWVQAKGAQQL